MEVNNSATVRFFLAWGLLAATAIALTGCSRAQAAPEAGNATIPRWCRGSECLVAYQQPEVELLGALDPEHALGTMLVDYLKPGRITGRARKPGGPADCGRGSGNAYLPCTPKRNPCAPRSVYDRVKKC